jgi:DNA modification methylase
MSRRRHELATVYYHTAEQMPEIRNGTAQLVIASPPFTNQSDGKTLDKRDYLEFFRRIVSESFRVLELDGILVTVNTDLRDHSRYNRGDTSFEGRLWQKHSDLLEIAEQSGFRCIEAKIWAKSLRRNQYRYAFAHIQFFEKAGLSAGRGRRRKIGSAFAPDVWLLEGGTYRRNSRGYVFRDAIHPEIVKRCVEEFTIPGDLIVSPFTGSGTVLSIAQSLGRRGIGYEINRDLRPLIQESIIAPEACLSSAMRRTKERRLFPE